MPGQRPRATSSSSNSPGDVARVAYDEVAATASAAGAAALGLAAAAGASEKELQRAPNHLVVGGAMLIVTTCGVVVAMIGWEEALAWFLDSVVQAQHNRWWVMRVFVLVLAGLFSFFPLTAMVFTLQGELLPLVVGFFFGWWHGVLVTVAAEFAALLCLVLFSESPTGQKVCRQLLKHWPAGAKLAARCSVALREGDDGLLLGLLLGFAPVPATVKDSAAVMALNLPLPRLLLLRMPSSAFYALCLAYFGHKSHVLAQHAATSGGGSLLTAGLPLGPAEICFGLSLAVALLLAGAISHSQLGLGMDANSVEDPDDAEEAELARLI